MQEEEERLGAESQNKVKFKQMQLNEERCVKLIVDMLFLSISKTKSLQSAPLLRLKLILLARRFSRINGMKIHNQWLKIMRLAKVESLRKEIEMLSQSHEREVDRKDATLQVRMHATHACNARNARMQCTHACTAEQGCHAGCGEGPFTETHTHTHARAPHAPHAAADA